MVVHTYNPNWEMEMEGSEVWGQPRLHSKILSQKKKKKTTKVIVSFLKSRRQPWWFLVHLQEPFCVCNWKVRSGTNSLSSFHLMSVPFSSNWQCSAEWPIRSNAPTHTSLLFKSCLATALVLSSEHAFPLFATWVGWGFYKPFKLWCLSV
jgi:hypothetical protein